MAFFVRTVTFLVPVILFLLSSLKAQVKSIDELSTTELFSVLQECREERSVLPFLTTVATDGKCGFGVRAQLHTFANRLPAGSRQLLLELLQPFTMQCTKTIGRFRIHYDTIGTNTPALLDSNQQRQEGTYNAFVDSVGKIFNEVWETEIDGYGFLPPIADGEYYEITIMEYAGAFYGETLFGAERSAGVPIRYETSIQIDNDFKEYKTKGLRGLRVTAAHEFHHAIQLSSYGWWGDDELYAYELTATWMESVVYPDIKDYYQYLDDYFSYFNGRSLNSTAYSGYERVVWALFLAEKFGADIMSAIWNRMRDVTFLRGVDAVLQQTYGTSLIKEFAAFTTWNYYTSYRADTTQSYRNGFAYPLYKPAATVSFAGARASASRRVEPLSSTLFQFVNISDTVDVMVANVDIEQALQRDTAKHSLEVIVSSLEPTTPHFQLDNGYYVSVEGSTSSLWSYRCFYDGKTVEPPHLVVSPQPFRLDQSFPLQLQVGGVLTNSMTIGFYTLTGSLVYSGEFRLVSKQSIKVASIPAEILRASLSSGVYFVVGKAECRSFLWKIAVVR